MSEKLSEGKVLEGKVTGIQPYGAFVALNEDIQGLVHISEVTNGYVKDINDHLSVGDEVKVKILNIDENNNKYSLSIRATEERPQQTTAKPKKQTAGRQQQNDTEAGFNTLRDKLQDWIQQSEDRESAFKN